MKPRLASISSMVLVLGAIALACSAEPTDAHVSPCEETVVSDEPITVRYESDVELDFDAAEVHLSYSDRPGDEACVFDAQVVLTKGGRSGCTLTLDAVSVADRNGHPELLIDHLRLSTNSACPTWGFTAPTTLERTFPPEYEINRPSAFGVIEVPDLVDEDDSCYAGEVNVQLFRVELSSPDGPTGIGPASMSFFVDVETTPESLPCATIM